MEITIKLPADMPPDTIEKVARYRKARAQQNAQRNRMSVVTIDPKLSDEQYLAAEIADAIVNDYREVIGNEAAYEAKKSRLKDFDATLTKKR